MHDQSNKKTCIESIKRFTIPPISFDLTNVHESNTNLGEIEQLIELQQGEEIICSTFINESLWSIMSTRRIFTLEGVRQEQHLLDEIVKFDPGDFKGYAKQNYTKGFLQFGDGKIVPVFIETGRASMVMIYGVKTMFDKSRVNREYFNYL